MCGKRAHFVAGNAAAFFDSGYYLFDASNGGARKGFPIEMHIESAIESAGNRDRFRILADAAK